MKRATQSRAEVTSSSTATHLGLCTTVGRVNYTPANDPEHPGRLLSSGSGTITAANGDTLLIEFNGVLDPARVVLQLLIDLSSASSGAQAGLPARAERPTP